MNMKFKDKSNETQKIYLKAVLDFYIDKCENLEFIDYGKHLDYFKEGSIFTENKDLLKKLKTLDIWQKDEVKEGDLCWFWCDNYTQGVIDTLKHINKTPTISYRSVKYGWLSNCEPIKKHIKELKKMEKCNDR